jgi:2-oxoglutarate dehydrogenase E2 component (dihydrolipoamide succinyltransferase)
MAYELKMPQLGESVIEGTIIHWLKQEGEFVKEFDPLLEVETDKVTVEVTSPYTGVLLQIVLPAGTLARAGQLIAVFGEAGEVITPAASTSPVAQSNGAGEQSHTAESANAKAIQISPVAARMAAQHEVDIAHVKGSGTGGRITKKDVAEVLQTPAAPALSDQVPMISPVVGRLITQYGFRLSDIRGTGQGGRVTKQDVLAYAAAPHATPSKAEVAIIPTPAQQPAPSPRPTTEGALVPLTGMRRAIAEHMVRSKHTSPHVTTVFEADFSAVAAHRQAHKAEFAAKGVALTFTPYMIAACAAALGQHPLVNASWEDGGIRLHPHIHIGMATALPNNGLIVPVLKHVDEKSLLGLAREVNDLADRARAGRLSPDEVAGATFTLTNHGTSGSLFATPIINQPQVAIIGLGKITKRPVVVGDALAIRPMAYLSLTFDHRVLDGASADAFLVSIQTMLENWV